MEPKVHYSGHKASYYIIATILLLIVLFWICLFHRFPYFTAIITNAQGCISTPPYAFVEWCLVTLRTRLHGMVFS